MPATFFYNLFTVVGPILLYMYFCTLFEKLDNKYLNSIVQFFLVTSIYFIATNTTLNNESSSILFSSILLSVAFIRRMEFTTVVSSGLLVFIATHIYGINIYISTLYCIMNAIIFYLCQNNNKRFAICFMLNSLTFYLISMSYSNILDSVTKVYAYLGTPVMYIVISLIAYIIIWNKDKVYIDNKVTNTYADSSVNTTIFNITHEIKNPLAVCKGYFEMMRDNDVAVKYVNILDAQVDRVLEILDQFLNLSNIEIETDVIDISMLVQYIEDTFENVFPESNVVPKFNIIDDEIFVNADYDKLKHAFNNLIRNAIEAMDKEEKALEINMTVKSNFIVIEIYDNGCGMNIDALNKIKNDVFFSTKDASSGTGVYVAKRIIKLHGGDIKYVSKPGKYTRCYIELPTVKY